MMIYKPANYIRLIYFFRLLSKFVNRPVKVSIYSGYDFCQPLLQTDIQIAFEF